MTLDTGRIITQLRDDIQTRRGYLAIGFLAISLLAPVLFAGYIFDIVLEMVIFALVVASWNLLAGYFGVFSFAHAAFFGVGGYSAAILAGHFGAPPVLTIFLGGIATGVASLVIAPLILRLSGSYVAMITLAYAEILRLSVYIFDDTTGGDSGYIEHPTLFGGEKILFYYFTLAVVLIGLFAIYLLLRSRFGLIGRAIREDEDAARVLGNNTYRYKMYAFIFSSSLAGIGGAIQAYNLRIFAPVMLEVNAMIEIMAMAIIGGLGLALGPIVGVITVLGLSEFLRSTGEIRLLVWGLMLIVIILYFPDGLMGSSVQKELLQEKAESFRSKVGMTNNTDSSNDK